MSELPLDQIICGDNCDVLGSFPRDCIDLVVTSPPYDDLRTYGGHEWDFYGVAWQLKRVLKPGGVIVWVVADATKDGSETGSSFEQALHFKRLGLKLWDTMVYATSKPPINDRRYQAEVEFMFIFSKHNPNTFNPVLVPSIHAGRKASGTYYNRDGTFKPRHLDNHPVSENRIKGNIWFFVERQGNGHPATFPTGLARDHILSWSNEGDIVLDPFNGSGTTTKMARELGRHFIGIDVNQEYCDIARQRIAQQLLW